MNITIETCKPETYVGCSAPTVDLPECEGGWEIGNNTATCVAVPPVSEPFLAGTGVDAGPLAGLGLAAVFALVVGAILLRRRA